MNGTQIYLIIGIISALAVIAVLIIGFSKMKPKKLSSMAALAFAFILAGIVFGENRIIGYGFFSIGIILSVIDAYLKSKKK